MDTIQKFQELLKGLFQFEASDLDFGIYRILNYKRDQIKRFIEKDLVDKVESAFVKHKDERLVNINQQFEEVKAKITQALGREAFTPAGELKEQFKDTPLGRDYLSIKTQKDEAQAIDEIRLQVFNDLYSFFSRFYEEGDFVPQYRYSIKGHKYAIPYDGEEVKLYWANNEQYYTKTGLLFRDYTFKAGDYKIIFRIVSAREELGSKKATKERFFVLDDENPIERVIASESEAISDGKALIIRLQYRELIEEEVKSYGVEGGSNTSKQEKINQTTYEEVLQIIKDVGLKACLSKEHKPVLSKSEGAEKPLLLYQLSRFTAKNTKDYFIHKTLKKFLSEQLDYFIKAEVLSIDTLEKERFLDKHITRAKVVREIGEDIIDFLSQIEDFQKRLWEKKKFVLKTEYVITTDRVPEELHDEIWNNKEQRKEWKGLGFETPKTKQELKRKKLPIDTAYLGQEFKEKLLERLTKNADLDDLLDGLLIKSENYQALNLLLGKYKEKIQTIYIDPPFNKEQDADYLYNVKYKDSTWVSCLENRLWLAKSLLDDKGNIFVRCDYNGNMYVRMLMNEVFGEECFKNEICIRKSGIQKEAKNKFLVATESLFYYTKQESAKPEELYESRETEWLPFVHYPGERQENKERLVFGVKLLPPNGRHWGINQPFIDRWVELKWIRFRCKKCGYEHQEGLWKSCPKCNSTDFAAEVKNPPKKIDSNWSNIQSYSQDPDFPTRNAEELLKRVIECSSSEKQLIMDFFLGSGTATAVAHKLNRKWVGVEMGEHFYPYIGKDGKPKGVLVRMKEVLAGKGNLEPYGITEEVGWQGGGFFEYQILEQYEDTLDNIELIPNKQAQLKFGDDYLLKYFLDYETKESPSLFNIECLKGPFVYKLRVNLEEVGEPQEMVADIPETFSYLLGLKVKKIKAREIASPTARSDKRKYLFTLGEKEGKNIAIVWRDYEDKWTEDDFKEDKEFIIKELQAWAPHIVYVNGQSVLTPKLGEHTVEIRHIESEFKRLMG